MKNVPDKDKRSWKILCIFFMQILRKMGFSENLPFNNFLKRTFYVSFYAKPIKRKI